ncbi:MAG TPA: adenylate/guanylate cyclase domain-containing protein [Nitrososphaeraceae archaeon]|nr:adenylate/guanylate cyclase domain-containing protein [Nitrososphaeraceae archaeon]
MTLPVDKLVTIIRAFSYEVSSVIQSHGGYVLKYVGDAVIAFFPSGYDSIRACHHSIECARSILSVIKNGINPILNQYDYPELSIKIGVDEGENVVVQYGHDKGSPIDILGYCISIAAKITSITESDKITVGKDVYFALGPILRNKFTEITPYTNDWRYTNRHWKSLQTVRNDIEDERICGRNKRAMPRVGDKVNLKCLTRTPMQLNYKYRLDERLYLNIS